MFYCFAFEALALELDCLRGAVQADFQWPYWWQLKRMSKADGFLCCLKLKLRKEWEGADKNLVRGRGAVDVGFLYGCWRRFDWIARKARLSAWCMGFSSSESMLVALILSYCWPICWRFVYYSDQFVQFINKPSHDAQARWIWNSFVHATLSNHILTTRVQVILNFVSFLLKLYRNFSLDIFGN